MAEPAKTEEALMAEVGGAAMAEVGGAAMMAGNA